MIKEAKEMHLSRSGIPNKMEAHNMLKEAEALNPGPWVAHSKNVARAAALLAEHIETLDVETAYVLGLLHDIGRRNGKAKKQ